MAVTFGINAMLSTCLAVAALAVVGVDARLPHALAHAYKALHLLTTSPVEWEQVFEDKFQRADGPVGSNYITGMMGTPPLNVTGHAACANTQAVAISTKVCSSNTSLFFESLF